MAILRRSSILAGLLLSVLLAAPGTAPAREPIIVGVPLPLSGSLSSFGNMMKNAMEMAREDILESGGIQGRPLRLEYGDTQGNPAVGETVIASLKAAGAVMLVGGYASDSTDRMAATAERLEIPFLICGASADRITRMGWRRIYRVNPPIREYTRGLEDFWLRNRRPQSVAIVFENSMFGTNAATHMMGFCRENAIEIHSVIGYPRDRTDPLFLRPLLAPLTREPLPDAIYAVSYLEDGVRVAREIHRLDTGAMICGGAAGFTQPAFLEAAGPAAEGMMVATLWSPCVRQPGAMEFHQEYLARYGDPPGYHAAAAHAALMVAADALARAETLAEAHIRRALDATTYLQTVFGMVKFTAHDGFERQNSHRPLLLQVIDGQFQCIWPEELAGAEFVPPERSPR